MTFPAEPHVSIILPIRNGMPHLQEAMKGVLAQTYKNYSLVVQDGLSTDGSLEYLRGLTPTFPIDIVSEHDGSVTIGYARAMKRATGDLVVAAACDEVLDPDALETYVGWYQEHPDAAFIYGGTRVIVTDSPSEGRNIQLYQPPAFSLIDYIYRRMTPCMAGAFNRKKLGPHLHLDETLKTCPDFELFTRLALTFGEDAIVGKKGFTSTTRGDRSSMTFRAENHMQFDSDKATVLERLLTGPFADAFTDYLRRDFQYSLHMAAASFIYGIAGDSEHYATHLLIADHQVPGRLRARQLASQSRYLKTSKNNRLYREEHLSPEAPDRATTEIVQSIHPGTLKILRESEAMGASLQVLSGGMVELLTTHNASYSAAVTLDISNCDFENYWHWIEIDGQVTQGLVHFILAHIDPANPKGETVFHQSWAHPTSQVSQIDLFIKPGKELRVVIANAGGTMVEKEGESSQSRILLHDLRILRTPKSRHARAAS